MTDELPEAALVLCPRVDGFLEELWRVAVPVPEALNETPDAVDLFVMSAVESNLIGQTSPWSLEWIPTGAISITERFLASVAKANLDLSSVTQLPGVSIGTDSLPGSHGSKFEVDPECTREINLIATSNVHPKIARWTGARCGVLGVAATTLVLMGGWALTAEISRRQSFETVIVRGGLSREPIGDDGPVPLSTQKPLEFRVEPNICEIENCTEQEPVRSIASGFTPGRSVEVKVQLPDGRDGNLVGKQYAYNPFSAVDDTGGFTWKWWTGKGAVAGIYRVTVRDVATGRLVTSTFRVADVVAPGATDQVGIKSNDTIVLIGSDGTAFLASRRFTISVSKRPSHYKSESIAKINGDVDLLASCQTQGQRITNGIRREAKASALTYSSNIWYGVSLNGKFGYIADTWSTRSNGLGLVSCGEIAAELPMIDADGILNPQPEDTR
jgi:hypothetical protein